MAREEQDMRANHEAESAIEPPPELLAPDPLVEKLVPDPSQPPTPTVSLTGLLGRSAKEGYWRLYFSSGLKRYVEFKEEDVLHSVKIPRLLDPPFAGMEATRVWLRHDAEVEYTRTESRRVQAEVLQGGLTARMPIDPPPDSLAVLRSPIDPPPDLAVPIDPPDGLLLRFGPIDPPTIRGIPEPI